MMRLLCALGERQRPAPNLRHRWHGKSLPCRCSKPLTLLSGLGEFCRSGLGAVEEGQDLRQGVAVLDEERVAAFVGVQLGPGDA